MQNQAQPQARNAKPSKPARKPVAKMAPPTREIQGIDSQETSVVLKCARSEPSMNRMLARLSANDQALLAEAQKTPGFKQSLTRELLARGAVKLTLRTDTVTYTDGRKVTRDPVPRLEGLAA